MSGRQRPLRVQPVRGIPPQTGRADRGRAQRTGEDRPRRHVQGEDGALQPGVGHREAAPHHAEYNQGEEHPQVAEVFFKCGSSRIFTYSISLN